MEIENQELVIEIIVQPAPVLEVEISIQPEVTIPNMDYNATAGMDMSSGRVVVIKDDVAIYFNPNDLSMYGLVTGITKTSCLTGQSIGIKLNGIFYESGLGLTPNAIYYAGINGALITNPTGLKLVQPVGSSISTETLNININSPIETL